MKKLFVGMLLATATFANAQWDKNGGIIFCKWGYSGGSTKLGNYLYETNPNDYSSLTQEPTVIASRDVKYKNKAIFCEIETIQKNLIFGMRFGFGFQKQGETPGFRSQDATWFNTTFGYGFHVKGKFSIIPTLRYNWNVFFQKGYPEGQVDLTPETVNASGYTETRSYGTLGGNQRGLGLNFVLPIGEKMILRGGYYYEWIFREKKQYKGLAKTPEIEFYLPFDDDHTFGFAFKIAMPNRKMYSTWTPDNTSIYQPETTMKSFIWEASLSIPLPSASTSTYVITVVD
ncbi:MAG TPA: hypothetical protein VK177_21165 [Flavobacteriales bacterium]|nr:hypothetical protein [Flavobacteriales bacterium]